MSEFKRAYVGNEVRRPGTEYVGGLQSTRRAVGVVVERFLAPEPEFPFDAYETGNRAGMDAYRTQLSIARGLPAQIKVYWQDTQTIEYLVEGEVEPNYPGGGCYRAWDREFPVLAVESGGYGDITVLTPDGEAAVFVASDSIHSADRSQADYKAQVLGAVAQYLDKTVPADDEPEETTDAEQFENAH